MAQDKLINVEPAEDLQKMSHDMNKMVTDTWVKQGVSAPLVSEADRKTGKVSDASSKALNDFGTMPK